MKFSDIFEIVRMNNKSIMCISKENGCEVFMTKRIFNKLLHEIEDVHYEYVEKTRKNNNEPIIWVGLVEVNIF